MHTITNCPKCKIDFMYHSTDTYLERDTTIIDEVGNNEVITTVICQDCDNVEKHYHNISQEIDLTSYESYKREVHESWNYGNINELRADGLITVDVEEKREDGSLSLQSYRILSEDEFNGRFTSNLINGLTIENVEEIVNNFPTKHKMGFVGSEILALLKEYNINNKDFFNKLGPNTVGVIDTEVVTYHCDILKGLRCVLENREQTLEEWD